jgi:hypothetical protein
MTTLKELIEAAREAREAHNAAARAEDDATADTPERAKAEAYTRQLSRKKDKIVAQVEGFPCVTIADIAAKLRFLAEEYDDFNVEAKKLEAVAQEVDRLLAA